MQKKYIAILNFLKETHHNFEALTQQLIFDKMHKLHQSVITLYGSIFELTGSCICLVDNQMATGIPILLRSLLEAFIDLSNLIKNPKYGHNLELDRLDQWIRLLRESKTNNSYLKYFKQVSDLDSLISQYEAEKKVLEDKGHKNLKIIEKFEIAGMSEEYKSIYVVLRFPQ